MTTPAAVTITETDIEQIAEFEGRVAVFVPPDGKLDPGARRANRQTKGAVGRMAEAESWGKMTPGDVRTLAWPAGMKAEALDVVCLPRNADVAEARKAGVALGRLKGDAALLVLANPVRRADEMLLGLVLRGYEFTAHKTAERDAPKGITVMTGKPDELKEAAAPHLTAAEGVFLTRDLVSEPANHLTTEEFASRIKGLEKSGLKVKILDEDEMRKLGMHLLLSVGHGSAMPSKLAILPSV